MTCRHAKDLRLLTLRQKSGCHQVGMASLDIVHDVLGQGSGEAVEDLDGLHQVSESAAPETTCHGSV